MRLIEFLANNGILCQCSCPSTPQQNGVAVRENWHESCVIHTLLHGSHASSSFWVETSPPLCYLINLLPSPLINHISPFEKLFHPSPNCSSLHIFGTCVLFF